jgi:hypothetical protein
MRGYNEFSVCPSRLPVCPVSKPDHPRIFTRATEILQNLKENMDAGNIYTSPDSGAQAIGEVVDK